MSRLGILALACALAACGPPRRRWVPRTPRAGDDAPAAFAVVRSETPLHVAPDRRAATVSIPTHGFVPMRIVREDDGWAHLETLGEPADAHCTEGLPRLAPFRLRLYAPIATLVPVTAREVTQSFADDTSIHLGRGVPLERLAQGDLHRAHLDGASVVVRVDATSIGTRYLPSPPLERGGTAQVLARDALRAAVPILGLTGRLAGTRALPVHARHDRGSEVVVEVRARCARVRVRAPAHAVVAADPPPPPPDPATGAPVVEPGATVYWANAEPAGVVTAPAALEDEIAPIEGRRCIRRPLDEGGHTVVILCFDPRAVIDAGRGAARRLDAPG